MASQRPHQRAATPGGRVCATRPAEHAIVPRVTNGSQPVPPSRGRCGAAPDPGVLPGVLAAGVRGREGGSGCRTLRGLVALDKVATKDAHDLLSDEEVGCVLDSPIAICPPARVLEPTHNGVEIVVLDPVALHQGSGLHERPDKPDGGVGQIPSRHPRLCAALVHARCCNVLRTLRHGT